MNKRSLLIGKDGSGPVFQVRTESHRCKKPKLGFNVGRDAHHVLDIQTGLHLSLLLVWASYKLVNFVVSFLGVRDEFGEK